MVLTITTLTNSTLILNLNSYSEDTWNDTTTYEKNTDVFTLNKLNKKIDSSIQLQNKTSQTPFFKQFIDRRENR